MRTPSCSALFMCKASGSKEDNGTNCSHSFTWKKSVEMERHKTQPGGEGKAAEKIKKICCFIEKTCASSEAGLTSRLN